MLKGREVLEKYLGNKFIEITSKKTTHRSICEYCQDKFNIPIGLTSDYLSMRISLSEASVFLLFCFSKALEDILRESVIVTKYFLDAEIKAFSEAKYETEKLKFPLRFKMLQVAQDQWIGVIDFKTLMKFRYAQIIHYEENTQRTLKRIIRGDNEIYVISINKAAVEDIKEAFNNNTYIPTALTLNIPEDGESEFYYDQDKMELVINSLKYFDIIDGYHRYLGACKACDSKKNNNYTMELRIVSFPEHKAKQFIYQEDQKTVMTKEDSSTYNVQNDANIITKRINDNPEFYLQGKVNNTDGVIKFYDLSELINILYMKDVKKEDSRKEILLVTKDIIESFNMFFEHNIKYLSCKRIHRDVLSIMMVCFSKFKGKDKTHMCEFIDDMFVKCADIDKGKLSSPSYWKRYIKRVKLVVEEEV